jgi:hypothetical protein
MLEGCVLSIAKRFSLCSRILLGSCEDPLRVDSRIGDDLVWCRRHLHEPSADE